jgi:hypothetical protein
MNAQIEWSVTRDALPPGFYWCQTCERVRGRTKRRFTLSKGNPEDIVQSRCLCEGQLCGFCLTYPIFRPGTSEYQVEDGRMWHQPGMVLSGPCARCRNDHALRMIYPGWFEHVNALSEVQQRRFACAIARLIEPSDHFMRVLKDLEDSCSEPIDRTRCTAFWRSLQPMAVSASIWHERAPSPRHVHTLAVAAAAAWSAAHAARAVLRHAMQWADFEGTPVTSSQMSVAIEAIVAGPK